jgi:hypothetical protein
VDEDAHVHDDEDLDESMTIAEIRARLKSVSLPASHTDTNNPSRLPKILVDNLAFEVDCTDEMLSDSIERWLDIENEDEVQLQILEEAIESSQKDIDPQSDSDEESDVIDLPCPLDWESAKTSIVNLTRFAANIDCPEAQELLLQAMQRLGKKVKQSEIERVQNTIQVTLHDAWKHVV